jgi:hypothetical protein
MSDLSIFKQQKQRVGLKQQQKQLKQQNKESD